jgi:DNA-binding transcriptional MerR regulator
MKIGELARKTGVSIRMLRYYEERGLLLPARTRTGYRDYDANTRETVRRIQALRRAGLNLDLIGKLLPCVRSAEPLFKPCEELRLQLSRAIRDSDAQIELLSEQRDMLAGFLAQLPATKS